MKENFKKLIEEGLLKAESKQLDIYTFALYHDHESRFARVCIDTLESSKEAVLSSNSFSNEEFLRSIEAGDLDSAALWNATIGRSLMLGDFSLVNASEMSVPSKVDSSSFYLAMVRAIQEKREAIERQSGHGQDLLFCCSTHSSEVGLIWS